MTPRLTDEWLAQALADATEDGRRAGARRIERLAIRIFGACHRMYPEHYLRSGPTPEKAWHHIDKSQRELFRYYADEAASYINSDEYLLLAPQDGLP